MEKQVLENAEKDLNAIKDIINRTTDTFASIGRIFIGWGIVFLVLSITIISTYLIRSSISLIIQKYPFTIVLPLILVALASFISYLIISKTKGFKGLSKPLLAIWLFIITYITVFPVIGYLNSISYYLKMSDVTFFFMPYADVGTLLFALSFGLLCIRLFTNLRFVGLLSLIYSILAFLSIIILYSNGIKNGELWMNISIIFFCAVIPATFFILGGYLEFSRARRS